MALNQELGGLRDVASAIISHERIQQNRLFCFEVLGAVFLKDRLYIKFKGK